MFSSGRYSGWARLAAIALFSIGTSISEATATSPGIALDIRPTATTGITDGIIGIEISIDPMTHLGEPADWWLVVYGNEGWHHLDLADLVLKPGILTTYRGPLLQFSNFPLAFPASGTDEYQVFFGVDLAANNRLDLAPGVLYYVGTIVNVENNWWRPAPGTSWQWQLSGTIDTSQDVDMYDLDLFDAPEPVISLLKGAGRTVICYFSAGSWEEWRDDAGQFPSSVLGNTLAGWSDERWLDIRNRQALAPILSARLDLAVEKGCDGVEPDNVDAYQNNTGFPLTAGDQLAFNRWLAEQAHERGLSVGLKNDLDQIPELVSDFDWALNEACFEMEECEALLPFVQMGKAVFGVEYSLSIGEFCDQANAMNFDWLLKDLDLGPERTACR